MNKAIGKTKKAAKRIKSYVVLTAAALIYAVAISLFLDPNDIAPGGVTGIAILMNRFTAIPTGTVNLLINIPIVLLGLWKFGWRFICSTLYALTMITIFINALADYGPVTQDLLIAAVIGGGLIGIALAMVFRAGATTGGIDIIVKVLRTKWRHIKTNILFLAFDSMVIIASWIVFQDLTVAFYAGVAVVVDSIVMDKILYGSDEAKLTYIISANPEQMKQRILDELDITATIIPARGAYTNEPRELLMIVTRKQMYPKIEEIVKDEDASAFMIVSSANEIFGEGYKDITRDKL
ncbi:MAG: YitT family protein [Lachnospiraceae bacterium]|nr:YitT family protein [Lachnospiraceae bacterium]MBO5144433.1 YitT family protein [Lachnospiraceae bacterium]